MKTSVARYQKLRNGAHSKFYSKSVQSQDSGIVEDGTEENMYKIYQNPDYEKQEKYAMMENIIKNPEVYDTDFKIYLINERLEDSNTNNKNRECKGIESTVTANESNNNVKKNSNESSSDRRCKTIPMDKYGSDIGSYYHAHPYIGSVPNDSSNYGYLDSSVNQEMTRQSNGDSSTSASSTKTIQDQVVISKVLNNIRKRFKGSEQSCDTSLEHEPSYDMKSQFYYAYTSPDIPTRYAKYHKNYYLEENYTFDEYETATSDSQTRLTKWSAVLDRLFKRSKFLRNLRMFWQQILCSTFFILGRDFDCNHNFCFELL